MPCQYRDSYISPNSLTPRLLTNLFCLTQGLIREALAIWCQLDITNIVRLGVNIRGVPGDLGSPLKVCAACQSARCGITCRDACAL